MSDTTNSIETSQPSRSKKKLIIFSLIGITLLCAVCVVSVAIGMIYMGSRDEGVNIDGDLNVYRGNGFIVGEPESWETQEYSGTLQMAPAGSTLSGTEEGSFFVLVQNTITEEHMDEWNDIEDGKCDKLTDIIEESFSSNEEDDINFKDAKSVKLNDAKGCKMVLSGKTKSQDKSFNVDGTVYAIKKGEKGFLVMAITTEGKNNADYQKAIEVARTFKAD